MNISKSIATLGLISLLALSGCSSTSEEVESTDNATDTTVVEETNETTEESESVEEDNSANEITVRAEACEDILADPNADTTADDYKGCKLEAEIPNLANFLFTEDASLIFQVIKNDDGTVVEIVSFKDSNSNNSFDEEERIDSYLVPTDVMLIEDVKDANPTISGDQVAELSSMIFVIPSE